MNGATKCFHLGDLFEGNQQFVNNLFSTKPEEVTYFEDEFYRQVNLFINEYPKPRLDEFKTYCLMGNHDETMAQFLMLRDYWCVSDLKKLSMYDSSFYMFPRTKWSTKLNGVEFHFDHRLYMSTLIRDLKISQLIMKKIKLIVDVIDKYIISTN